jgi:hypothetical protein
MPGPLPELACDLLFQAPMVRSGKVGRPSSVLPWAAPVREILAADPGLCTAEILRRIRSLGYAGGKTALYHLVALCRPHPQPEK